MGNLLPYGRQSVVDEDIEAVAAVLRGDWLTTGPAVRQFEASYTAGLSDVDGVRTPVTLPGADPMWHLYALRVLDRRRRALYEHLRANGIA